MRLLPPRLMVVQFILRGEVVNAACAVNMNSVDQTVLLGQVRSATLGSDGKTSGSVGFTIQLDDCDLTTGPTQSAKIIFSGTPVTGKTNVLALQNSASGAATNVGIQILDSKGQPVELNSDAASEYTLTDGTNKNSVPGSLLCNRTGHCWYCQCRRHL